MVHGMTAGHWVAGCVIGMLAVLAAGCASWQQGQAAEGRVEPFAIRKGLGVAYWLAFNDRKRPGYDQAVTEEDIRKIRELGFDHIRLVFDEAVMWDEEGKQVEASWAALHRGLGWCRKHDLKVVLTFNVLRSHHFNEKVRPLWVQPAAQAQFVGYWREVSAACRGYGNDFLAYELLNEAVADDPEDWNRLIAKGVAAIREGEPERKIVVGSNKWQHVRTFKDLKVPAGDRNIILSFHFYEPHLLTHYRAHWTETGAYTGPVHYPGQTIDPKDIDERALPADALAQIKWRNGAYTRESLDAMIGQAQEVADRLGLQLYCGEFGAVYHVPRELRLRWLSDVTALLERRGIAWTFWLYEEPHGAVMALITDDKGTVDREVMAILR